MAWNEPGNESGKQSGDPSGSGSNNGGPRDPWGNRPQQAPPDLDELLTKLRTKFGGGGGSGRSGGRSGGGWSPGKGLISLLIVIAVLLWGVSGIYIVDEKERGVVLQFGKYIATTEPGLRWHVPSPIQTVEKVQVTEIREIEERSSMLTQDENIVDVSLNVFYRVASAKDYLFDMRNPDTVVREATKSAIREVVGKSDMDFIITAGRSAVANRTQERLQETLDFYYSGFRDADVGQEASRQPGIIITEVNLEEADPPGPVKGAFEDAIKAREDQERLINESEAYSNDLLPRARGSAARDIEQSEGYRQRVVERAKGEAARFESLLAEYKRAPGVTRDRLFLDAMSDVLEANQNIIVDTKDGSPLLYLPIDQLGKKAGAKGGSGRAERSSSASQSSAYPQDQVEQTDRSRSRGRR